MPRFAPIKRFNYKASTNKSANAGKHLFKPEANVWETFVPFSQGYLVFKILPGLNPDDGGETFDPMWRSPFEFGSWQTSIPVVSCGKGDKMVTFCPLDSTADATSLDDTPYYLVYNMLNEMRKRPIGDAGRVDAWVALLQDSGPTESATIPKPQEHTFAFIIPIYNAKGIVDIEQNKNHINVLHLKTLGARALRDVCEECSRANPEIDLTDFRDGPLVSMWSSNVADPWTGTPSNRDDRNYHTRLLEAVPGTNITKDFSRDREFYKNILAPWEYLIETPSLEQQAKWIMDVLPLDLLARAWETSGGNYRDFVTQEMAQKLDDGCRAAIQAEQARQAAQFAQMSRRFQTTPQQQSLPHDPITPLFQQPGTQTPPPNTQSSIPGFTPLGGYPPVPNQYGNLMNNPKQQPEFKPPFDTDDPDMERL